MCGFAGIFGQEWTRAQLQAMLDWRRRGPDGEGIFSDWTGIAGLASIRYALGSPAAAADAQPVSNLDQTVWVVSSGEIRNQAELKAELRDYPFRTGSTAELILAAYQRWGIHCPERLHGPVAFLLWDAQRMSAFAVRDRIGIVPLHFHRKPDGTLLLAGDLRALHAAGVHALPDESVWASYLAFGSRAPAGRTFWRDIHTVPPGHALLWEDGGTRLRRWYDPARTDAQTRPDPQALTACVDDSLAPRGRTPGLVLRGTLESSLLSAAAPSDFMGFICTTRETREIELPWVSRIAAAAGRPWQTTELTPEETPDLAAALQRELAEPFGGLSSVAAAKLAGFAQAHGVALLLESQGLHLPGPAGVPPLRPDCLRPEFRNLADPLTAPPDAPLARLHEGEPLAARCCSSIERRYPFLDPRHVGPLLGQPPERREALLRETARLVPGAIPDAPARPPRLPHREWLTGPLRSWCSERIDAVLAGWGRDWFFPDTVHRAWSAYLDAAGAGGSFYVWQWVNLGLFTGSEPLSMQTPEENRRP